jgi:formylglycine-generating enzyme required for sulfatase activity
MRVTPARFAPALVLTAALAACQRAGAARSEVVLVLDTDAPLVGELGVHPEISPDSAVDTVRVDILDGSDDVTDVRTFLAPELAEWPLSFGVVPPAEGPARVRIRLFRALLANPGMVSGIAVLDPPPQVTIERLVEVTASDSLRRLRVLLTEDCLGTASTFVSPETTCIDASELAGPPSDGLEEVSTDDPPSVAGTWAPAQEVACSSPAPPSTVCIPGGFSILGEAELAGQSDTHGYDPVPLRPVALSPFFLDTTEYTVGRFRALLARTAFGGRMPIPNQGTGPADENFCTWLGPAVAQNDKLPLNCVPWETATLACQLEGGTLPSEAQWEHAARGRGQRRIYPWGNADSTCCATSASRQASPGDAFHCTGVGIEPVGSHPPTASCHGIGDVSRDGVVDMEGSLGEAMADSLDPYDAPCWTAGGILRDPICQDSMAPGYAARGSNWYSDLNVATAQRVLWTANPDRGWGFRCAYPDKGSP